MTFPHPPSIPDEPQTRLFSPSTPATSKARREYEERIAAGYAALFSDAEMARIEAAIAEKRAVLAALRVLKLV